MRQALTAMHACARASTKRVWVYRVEVFTSAALLLIQVVLLFVVWRTVYGESGAVRGIAKQQAVSYAVLAVCIQSAIMPWDFSGLERRVRTGQVGIDMTRPIGLIPQVFAQNVGTFVAKLPTMVLGILWAIALGALSLPPSSRMFVAWVVATALGILLAMLMNLLVSMACFWSLEIGGYMMLYRLGSGLLSGALIPLWFMPGWLAGILNWLPFRAQMFTPLSIYFGQVDEATAWTSIAVQAAWIAAAVGLLVLVWAKAKRKVVILGG